MAIIANRKKPTTVKLKSEEIESSIYKEINDYCNWAGIDDISFFIEDAAKYVFKSDSDWKKHKKSLAKDSVTKEQA